MSTRIIVTGASGVLGTALLRRLAETPGRYDVVGVVRHPPPSAGPYRDVAWHRLDVAGPEAPPRLRAMCAEADCVVHLAWACRPTRSVDHLYRVGVGGTTALLQAAYDAGVGQFVHLSSAAVYAPGRRGRHVTESWSTAGVSTSIYSRTKSAVETLLDDFQAMHRHAMVVTRLRPAMTLHHVPPLLRRLRVLPLDRAFLLPFVDVDDVADALLRAIERRAGGPFNLAAEPPVDRAQLGALLGAVPVGVPTGLLAGVLQTSWRLRVQPLDRGWADAALTAPLLDTSRARERLGWRPSADGPPVLGSHACDVPTVASRRS